MSIKLIKSISFFFCKVDTEYIAYLHKIDSHVYYIEDDAEYNEKERPYLCFYSSANNHLYGIPITSNKKWHRKWDEIDYDHWAILLYEYIHGIRRSRNMSALRPCYMIPLIDGVFSEVDIESNSLVQKELNRAKDLQEEIEKMVNKIYVKQMIMQNIDRNHEIDFRRLEKYCNKFIKS